MKLSLPSLSLWYIATVAYIQLGSSSQCSKWNSINNNRYYDTTCYSKRTLVCKNITLDLTTYYDTDNNYYYNSNLCDILNVEDSYNPFITSASFNQQVKHLLFELNLRNNCIQSIANDTFINFSKLRVINFDHNELGNLDFIDDISELRQLSVRNNNLTQLYASNFEKLKELESLNMAYNKLTSIGNESLKLYSLQTIALSNNNSKRTEANIFSNLHKLQFLNLSSNKLEFIEIHAFKGLNKLISLDLSANKLKSLQEETFFGLSSLQNLKLNYNCLENILAKIFSDLKKLKGLDLSSNKISTLATDSFIGLDKLKQLLLSNNTIKEVPLGCFRTIPKLEILNLDINYLTQLKTGSFSNLKELIHLNLSHNRFYAVNEVVLYPLSNLQLLDLDNNSLSFINYTSLLLHVPSLHFISINNNIWSCKFLTNMLKMFRAEGKNYLFNATSRYTEENVDGILCSESETGEEINESDFDNIVLERKMHSAVFKNISDDATDFKTYLPNMVTSIKDNTNALIQLLQYYNRSKTINLPFEGEDGAINKNVTLEKLYQLVDNNSTSFTLDVTNSNFNFTDFFIVILLCIVVVCILLTLTLNMKYFRKVLEYKRMHETSSVNL